MRGMRAAHRVLVVEERRVLDLVLAALLAAILPHVEVPRVVPQPAEHINIKLAIVLGAHELLRPTVAVYHHWPF